ncbi:MAG: biotin--[acetyl-CoA-carboxylase] ligase [Candidatus Bipolaricaulota bacterium]|nr:MAG: biotin--[acetyl-CoA-carboxylase] ligase [Candidatus Bipolaricaulota bacterium]
MKRRGTESREWRVHRVGIADSTQDMAREFALQGDRGPLAIVAETQRRGRGRRGRRWLSPRGGLYASLLTPPRELLFAHAGLAVADALGEIGVEPTLSWPNDVFVRDRKIAGILIEVVARTAIVGIGINVRASPLPTATSIAAEGGSRLDAPELLRSLLASFDASTATDPLPRYRARCSVLGREVRVERISSAEETALVGRAIDIDGAGRLLVARDDEVVAVSSGDCALLTARSPGEVKGGG